MYFFRKVLHVSVLQNIDINMLNRRAYKHVWTSLIKVYRNGNVCKIIFIW